MAARRQSKGGASYIGNGKTRGKKGLRTRLLQKKGPSRAYVLPPVRGPKRNGFARAQQCVVVGG